MKFYRNNRACSLGKGQRFDFTKFKKGVPPPNNYKINLGNKYSYGHLIKLVKE